VVARTMKRMFAEIRILLSAVFLFPVFLLLFVLPSTALAITRDSSSVFNSNSSTVSGSYVMGSGVDSVITVQLYCSGASTASAAFAGESMTQYGSYDSGYGVGFSFALVNPPDGSATFSATCVGGSALYAHVQSYFGVDQTIPIDVFESGLNSSGTTVNLGITTLADGAWTISMARNAGGGSSGATYTSANQSLLINNYYSGYYQSMSGDSDGVMGSAGEYVVIASPGGNASIIWGIISSLKPSSVSTTTATSTASSTDILRAIESISFQLAILMVLVFFAFISYLYSLLFKQSTK